jgi:type IV fimbrial biogenesis protein FimT
MQQVSKARQLGFTMVELLTVLTIIGILLALATPSMARFAADWRVKNAGNSLIGQLRLARVEAIRQSRPVILCPVTSAGNLTCDSTTQEWKNGWLLFVDVNNNGAYDSATDKLLKQQDSLTGLASMQKSQAGSMAFWPTGLMRLSSSTNKFSVSSAYQENGDSAIKSYYCISSVGRVRKLTGSAVNC